MHERIHVVGDTGSSFRPGQPETKSFTDVLTFLPLSVTFRTPTGSRSVSDLELPPEEFYDHLEHDPIHPQTDGSVLGPAIIEYSRLAEHRVSGISIHLAAATSGGYNSALNARDVVREKFPDLQINIIDSKTISGAVWFLLKHAAVASQRGATLEQITTDVNEMIPYVHVITVLSTLDDLQKGGRAKDLFAALAMKMLRVVPIIGVNQKGKITPVELARTPGKGKERMLELVGDSGKIADLVVIHTHAEEAALAFRENLRKVVPSDQFQTLFPNDIPIVEAGSAIATHAGAGAIGVAYRNRP